MSQENVEVIERAYAAWNQTGLDAFSEYWAENTQWRSIEGDPVYRGPMHGRDAVRAYLEDWLDMFDDFRVEPVELVDAGGAGNAHFARLLAFAADSEPCPETGQIRPDPTRR